MQALAVVPLPRRAQGQAGEHGVGSGLFTASGVVWVAVLVPVQARLGTLARGFAHGGAIPPHYWALERIWLVGGTVATCCRWRSSP